MRSSLESLLGLRVNLWVSAVTLVAAVTVLIRRNSGEPLQAGAAAIGDIDLAALAATSSPPTGRPRQASCSKAPQTG